MMAGFSQSRFAAWTQNLVARRREESGLYRDYAAQLPRLDSGRLLDIGTGSGLMLKDVHDIMPQVELFGLDLSANSIRVARRNLAGMSVDLRVGSIEHAPYDDGLFDVATCQSSMSYWQNPVACFDEIYRILKPGGRAVLFEPQKDIDVDVAVATIRAQLADASPLRRWAAGALNSFALRRGQRVGLRLYSVQELQALAQRSRFDANYSVEPATIQNLAIFVRISLLKP
jgi:ubiquinone/menaquinone biosynthesis C-methylase UbiE